MSQPAPPQSGAPLLPPVPRPRRKRWPWLVGVAVILVLVVGGGLHAYFARTASSSPRGAVDHYWGALVAHDAGKAQRYICRGRPLPQKDTPFGKQFVSSLSGYAVGAESGSGKTRVFGVVARLNVSGRAYDFPLQTKVIKQWNGWFVCDGA